MTTTPMSGGNVVHTLDRSGLRGRLDDLKWRGKAKLHSLQGQVSEQRVAVKESMRTSPMKWAGIAAASGFAIGLIGRLLQVRRNRVNRLPQLVVIEASC